MRRLNLPDKLRSTLEQLANLSEAKIASIRNAVASSLPNLNPEIMADSIPETQRDGIQNLADIVAMLYSLNTARFNADASLEKFAKDVAESVSDDADGRVKPQVLEMILKTLLDIEPVVRSAKANDVQNEYQAIFRNARIVSDIRPVFDSSADTPIGALIVHNFKIGYYEGGHYKELYLALDKTDLASVKKAVDRAEAKSSCLEKVIESADLRYFQSR